MKTISETNEREIIRLLSCAATTVEALSQKERDRNLARRCRLMAAKLKLKPASAGILKDLYLKKISNN
ncbi:MAG: hypothetical protein LBL07_03850 [Tannerella sp.]|jgi:hypothetical protein|nr:hypothetical protein [Tannerella sp.]